MKLVFIHGRGQGTNSEQAIREYWTEAMQRGFTRAKVPKVNLGQIHVPFYGATLDEAASRVVSGPARVLERGEATAEVEFDDFAAQIVLRIVERAGLDRQLAMDEAGLTVVERGPERWEWVQALLRASERKLPWLARFGIGAFTADVETYLESPSAQAAVHNIVIPAISSGPSVVIAHSLGSIVAYKVLVEHPELRVPHLFTIGSPLGINVIKDHLQHPLRFPSGVGEWTNVSDEDDVVALYSRLDRNTFIEGIENISDVDNGDEPHDIAKYLEDTNVARKLADALS